MKNAFVNAAGVLTSWGYAESNGADTKVAVAEDFDLAPGQWKWVGGAWVAATPTPDQIKAAGEAAIQNLLDTTAQAHGYDSLERCISYIGDANAFWSAEGTRAKAWRSECWSKAKQIQDDATAGNWPTAGAAQTPTVADVVAAMPPANWPVA